MGYLRWRLGCHIAVLFNLMLVDKLFLNKLPNDKESVALYRDRYCAERNECMLELLIS